MAFNPFNPDGTWNYSDAAKSTDAEVNEAWKKFKKDKGIDDVTDPPKSARRPTHWEELINSARRAQEASEYSWQFNTGNSYGPGVNDPFFEDPWANEREPRVSKFRFESRKEESAFHDWVRIETKGVGTRGTDEHYYRQWEIWGKKHWMLYGNDPFLWGMKGEERNSYYEFRDKLGGGIHAYAEGEIRVMWKAKQRTTSEEREHFTTGGRRTGSFYTDPPKNEYWKADHQERTGSFRNYKQQLQYAALQKIMQTQFDMIASAFGEHERKRRRMEENDYRSANPVGVIKVTSAAPDLCARLLIKLGKEMEAGRITKAEMYMALGWVYPEAEIVTKQANKIAEFLLNPLTKTDYHVYETVKADRLR